MIATIRTILQRPVLAEALQAAVAIEQRYDGEIEGVPVRCKPDIVRDMGGFILVHDLKFTEQRPSPEVFHRADRRLRLWIQDAHYSKILAQHYRKPVRFSFLFCEAKYPFRVHPYWHNVITREETFDAHAKHMRKLKLCMEDGEWLDEWESEVVLNPWDISANEEMVEVSQ